MIGSVINNCLGSIYARPCFRGCGNSEEQNRQAPVLRKLSFQWETSNKLKKIESFSMLDSGK